MSQLNKPRHELQELVATLRPAAMQVAAFSFVSNMLMLVPTLYMLQIYDRVLNSRSGLTLVMLTLIVVVMYLLLAALDWVRQRLLMDAGQQVATTLSARVFTAAFERNLTRRGGSPIQALQDVASLRQFVSGGTLVTFFDAPWLPIYLIAITLLHPWLGLFSLVGAIVLFVLALVNESATAKPLADAGTEAAGAHLTAANNLKHAEVIEAMGMLAAIRSRWQARHDKSMEYQQVAAGRGATVAAVTKGARMLFQSLILGLGAWLAINNEITPGGMIAGSILMGRALSPVESAIGTWRTWVGTRQAWHRLFELLGAYPVRAASMPLPAPRGDLALEGVTVVPPGSNRPVLTDLKFGINAGDVVAVIGPSAAGKSSLARVLAGIWAPVRGAVRLSGADVSKWNKADLGPHMGYLPQDIELFEGTVAENIARFGKVDSSAVIAAATLAGIHEEILRLGLGYDSAVGVDGNVLSAGQRQRIGLARAFYGNPKVLILDEPNSNLDEAGEAALANALRAAKATGTTVVVITHRSGLLEVADKVLVLRGGSLFAYGPRDAVLAHLKNPQGAQPALPQPVAARAAAGGVA